jgi:hypothetical protein
MLPRGVIEGEKHFTIMGRNVAVKSRGGGKRAPTTKDHSTTKDRSTVNVERSTVNKERGNTRAPRLEAMNLAGLTSLMNQKELQKDLDLEQVEDAFMGKSSNAEALGFEKEEMSPIDLYDKELADIADDLGIDFGAGQPKSKEGKTSMIDDIDDFLGKLGVGTDSADESGSSGGSSRSSYTESSGSSRSRSSSYTGSTSGSYTDESGSYSGSTSGSTGSESYTDSESGSMSESEVDEALVNIGKELGISLRGGARDSKRHRKVKYHKHDHKRDHHRDGHHHERDHHAHRDEHRDNRTSGLQFLTEEQEKREHLESVMGEMRRETQTPHGLDQIRSQESKARKLEEISRLLLTLEEEGIDCSSVRKNMPSERSPIDEIDSVLLVLKHKNDSNRYSTIGEEVLLGGAEFIETVFDGTREIPIVGWKPDYTGYHNTVNVKLHRMRFETSQLVGSIIERNNIGPMSRIILELLPSFFLYPRTQSRRQGGLHNDPSVQQRAYARLNNSNITDNLDDLKDI